MPAPSRTPIDLPLTRLLAGVLLTLPLLPACGPGGSGRHTADQAMSLYDQGQYARALPRLQQAAERGERNGSVLYQLGYCRSQVEHDEKGTKQAWAEARPILEKEIAAPGGATLERLYYLTRLAADDQAFDKTTQYARQGVEQYEKGPNPNTLSGADWFRLGRLHEFLNEQSGAEAAYRLAISAYGKSPQGGSAYHSLALGRVGDFDYDGGRYKEAVEHYDAAVKVFPGTDQIDPYRYGLVLLSVGRFDEAVIRLAAVRDEANIDEGQYGADLARKAKEVAPLKDSDADGTLLKTLPDDELRKRIQAAGRSLRGSRTKNSMKPGDPLPAEVADQQRRFVALLCEKMVRTKQIQHFCLEEGIADLVRR